ncbi:MAG: peptidylprolyl isomerase [Smithella sp.]|nr:peptidylprolyl isomerase [Smithella sp.]
MRNRLSRLWPIMILLFVFVISGCSKSGEKDSGTVTGDAAVVQEAVSDLSSGQSEPEVKAENNKRTDIVASVDGKVLKKSELENNVKERMRILKDQIPADKRKEFQQNLSRQLTESFIIRTLLENEIDKRKITANSDEIVKTMNNIKASLPPEKKMDDFLKENRITQEDIIFAVRAEKFKNMVVGKKAKPTQKEISKFYSDNKENLFTEPESVHVRHILVALGKDEDDKVQAEKKEKIESLRNQLLNGGNFVELAAKNSDCPSKEVGGDLNFLRRGQTVKAFEDAAFSQEKNAIGPVVKTEFGYHIIQVLDKRPSKKVALEDVKDRISNHLEQAKQVEVFNAVLNDLKEKAKIEIY